jgi:hypothetical protein
VLEALAEKLNLEGIEMAHVVAREEIYKFVFWKE